MMLGVRSIFDESDITSSALEVWPVLMQSNTGPDGNKEIKNYEYLCL